MNVPIITLTVEGMQQTVRQALLAHAATMSQEIQIAVDQYVTPENIQAVVDSSVRKHIDECLREAVKDFFGWSGAGRQAVRDAVLQRLNEQYPNNQPERL